MKKMSRVLALTLALALCFSCMAVSVFATDEECPHCGKPIFSHECKADQNGCDIDTETGECKLLKSVHSAETCSENPANKPADGPGSGSSSSGSSSSSSSSKSSSKGYIPDVSGHYRTSANNIRQNVKPVEVAQQNLYIDPVTNSVVNLYDSMGNLIPCTLSSDGHFYIVPTNDGYVYIPTGK